MCVCVCVCVRERERCIVRVMIRFLPMTLVHVIMSSEYVCRTIYCPDISPHELRLQYLELRTPVTRMPIDV